MNKNTLWWLILIVVIILGAYFSVVNRQAEESDTSSFPDVSVNQGRNATSSVPLIHVTPKAK